MLRERVLKVLIPFPRSTALIRYAVNQSGDLVSYNQVRKVLRELEAEGLVTSGEYAYNKGQIEWRLNELRGE